MRTAKTLLVLALAAGLAVSALAGCTPSSTQTSGGGTSVAPAKIRIGTLTTEDALPLWVAERDGLFKKAGLDVSITVFQSAQERDAALTAKSIDGFMGDIIAAAALRAGGVPVKITTIMLGATPKEGRFGIVVAPGSKITSLEELAGVPVGTSSGTIQEYVLDGLMGQAGIPIDQVKKEEVKKVPVRFELLMSGKLQAAALPEPFLSLAVLSAPRFRNAFRSRSLLAFYAIATLACLAMCFGPSGKMMGEAIVEKPPYWWFLKLPGIENLLDADHIVKGEGIRWFRQFLGEDDGQPIRHPLIKSGIGTRSAGITVAVLVSQALGRIIDLDFCFPFGEA